ncbi:MAG: zinc metallopeptidase [Candidatus Coprovivens sp.]
MDLILYLAVLIIPIIAQINISSTYSKCRNIANSKGLCGQEVARKILDANGLDNVHIVEVRGNLSDHYDPNQKVVRLSTEVFHGESVASLAVAAHECGHAIQDKENYTWLRIRTFFVPIVNLITYSAYIMFFVSIFLQLIDLLLVAVASVLIGLIFQLITLPVEFNASDRALKQLNKLSLVTKEDSEGASQMLKAAAWTYVAAVLSSLLNLLRLMRYFDRD